MKDLPKRVLSAVILLAILIPLIIIGKVPFAIAIGLVGVMAYYEIMKLYKFNIVIRVLSFIVLMGFIYSSVDPNMLTFGLNYRVIAITMLLLLSPVVYYQPKEKYDIEDAFKLYGFLLLIGVGLNFFILIRNLDIKYFILLLLVPMITDTFAYVGGMMIGKHKFSKISPKKSIEGVIVGTLMGTFIGSMYYMTVFTDTKNMLIIILIILFMSIMGQVGDIFFSAIKRKHDIKDFSNLIPGHGGIMDRLDSLIFAALVMVIFIRFL